MNKLNILQNYRNDFLKSKPFPFFEIKNALPDKIYDELKKDYHIFDDFFNKDTNAKKNNARLQVNSDIILKNERLFKSSIWYDFVKYHTSKEFVDELLNIFDDDIKKIYPDIKLLIENKRNNENFVSHRSSTNINIFEFVADCQPGINTPVQYFSSVRGPHIDNPVELIGGLFYLRDANDDSKGGDLTIYEAKNDIYFKDKAEVENVDNLKLIKTIKYDKNHCLFFLNTQNSIHAISPREKTDFKRYLTNIIVERYKDSNGLFKIKRKNFLQKILKLS